MQTTLTFVLFSFPQYLVSPGRVYFQQVEPIQSSVDAGVDSSEPPLQVIDIDQIGGHDRKGQKRDEWTNDRETDITEKREQRRTQRERCDALMKVTSKDPGDLLLSKTEVLYEGYRMFLHGDQKFKPQVRYKNNYDIPYRSKLYSCVL